jgi:hypothetical protein
MYITLSSKKSLRFFSKIIVYWNAKSSKRTGCGIILMLSLELQRYNTCESIYIILYEYIRICDVFLGGRNNWRCCFYSSNFVSNRGVHSVSYHKSHHNYSSIFVMTWTMTISSTPHPLQTIKTVPHLVELEVHTILVYRYL